MPLSLLITGLLLGLDSFVVCLALGTSPENRARRLALAICFGLCDGLASWLGATGIGVRLTSFAVLDWLGPVAVGSYGLFVLALACGARHFPRFPRLGSWLVFALPVCLSLDNLAVGVGLETSGGTSIVTALGLGLASGCLSLLGFSLGTKIANRVRFRTDWLAGIGLILVAFVLLCKEVLS
jgi:putative Mn2+ efflux pump MntP